MEEKKKVYTKTIYVAYDGKEFDSEYSCDAYESELKQDKLEKEATDRFGISTPNSNFPAMLNNRYNHEYKLFLIKNESDLDFFIEVYEYWFTNLKDYWQVNKETFEYPEVLCILDFPTGGDEHRLYKMSSLFRQFNAFSEELNYMIDQN